MKRKKEKKNRSAWPGKYKDGGKEKLGLVVKTITMREREREREREC